MMKKKIAFVTPIYLPANLYGSDFFVKIMAENLAMNGYDVSVITSNALTPRYWYDKLWGKKIQNKYETIENVKIIRLECKQIVFLFSYILTKLLKYIMPQSLIDKLKLMYNGPYLNNLHRTLKSGDYDVIHCSPFPLFLNKQVILSLEKLNRKPQLILTPFYHTEVKDYNNSELKRMLGKATIIHAVSSVEKKEIIKRFNISPKRITVIPLFINTSALHLQSQMKMDINRIRKEYSLDTRFIILFAGIKGAMKGACDLLSTVNKLYEKNNKFLLIAIGHNTKEWEDKKKTINPKCLLDFSYVDGYKKELFFALCDIFCMPSKSESFGLVYLEAWHKKKPVIGANIESVKELIGNAKGGILVKYSDSKNLEYAINTLYSDSSLRHSLGKMGYESLMEKYNLAKVFPQYLNLFNKLS